MTEETSEAVLSAGAEDDASTFDLTAEDAVDWLVRSAVPKFLSLLSQDEQAAHFVALPPFQGLTDSGRLRGWQGVGRRILEAHGLVEDGFVRAINLVSQPLPHIDRSDAELQVRQVAYFAARAIAPSRVGWNAYRLITHTARFAEYSAAAFGAPIEDLQETWYQCDSALTDRAQLRQMS